tara:strand:- start:243 stop:461 length:219 start_codon:yes stop_codon:yes gene_type:complete
MAEYEFEVDTKVEALLLMQFRMQILTLAVLMENASNDTATKALEESERLFKELQDTLHEISIENRNDGEMNE